MIRLFLIFVGLTTFGSLHSNAYEDAYTAYQKGEEGATVEERSTYFNEALRLYSYQEKEDGKLYYNIANCYYQLNQTGMAIWYYLRAERLLPRDIKIKENLLKANVQVALPTSSWESVVRRVFFFHYQLKPNEQALLCILFAALVVILISVSLWIKKANLKPLIYISLFCSVALGMSHIKTQEKNKQGLFVESSLMRCAAGMQYKEVDNEIISPGQRFKVLEISEDEQWIKVKVSSRRCGYVLAKHIRLL